MKLRILTLTALSLLLFTCTKEKGDLKPAEINCADITFKDDINPIIAAKCATAACHENGFIYGDFKDYSGVKDRVDNGSIKLRVLDLKLMPPSGPLPPDELKMIQCWLDAGAPNN